MKVRLQDRDGRGFLARPSAPPATNVPTLTSVSRQAPALFVLDQASITETSAILRAHQLRPTAVRVHVLAVLRSHSTTGVLVNPHDICRALLGAGLNTILPTVYNVLSALEERGIIRRIRLGDRPAMYAFGPSSTPLAILVCERCDELRPVFLPAIHAELAALGSRHGFTVSENALVVRGRCPTCKADEPLGKPIAST